MLNVGGFCPGGFCLAVFCRGAFDLDSIRDIALNITNGFFVISILALEECRNFLVCETLSCVQFLCSSRIETQTETETKTHLKLKLKLI